MAVTTPERPTMAPPGRRWLRLALTVAAFLLLAEGLAGPGWRLDEVQRDDAFAYLLLRAVVAPLILIATVLLSYLATLGVCALLFGALGFAGTQPSFPLLAFVFLVALGADYTIFLMSRVREESTSAFYSTRSSCGRCWCRRSPSRSGPAVVAFRSALCTVRGSGRA